MSIQYCSYGIDRGHPEPRGQHAVERAGNPTALDMADHRHPGLDARALLDHGRQQFADSAQPGTVESVEALVRVRGLHGVEVETLGHDDDGRTTATASVRNPLTDLLDVLRLLRDQDGVGPSGHPGVQRDPPSVPA